MRTFIVILWLLVQSLAHASTLTFSYDAAGRLVNVNYGGNTNTSSSFDNNGNLLNQSTFVSANPDLGIAQFATPSPVLVGKPLQYTVTVFNDSVAAASTIKLTNMLPANVTFLSNTVSQGSVVHSGNILNWAVGKLTNAAAATLTFTVVPTAIGHVTNTAIVKSSVTDPAAVDNINTLVSTVVGPPMALGGVSDQGFVISWSLAGGDGFSVQYSDSLAPPILWTPLPIEPGINGDSFFVEDAVTNSHRFYRLVSP